MDNKKNNVEKNNKKVILLIGIVLSILVVLVFSATYAYFSVNTSNNFGSSTIDTTAEGVGSIALSGTNANLLLSVSRTDMMRDESNSCKVAHSCDKTYYASSSGKTLTPTEETIGTIAVTGNGNFTCTYTLNITHTGTKDLYNTFKSNGYTNKGDGQIILTINGEDYDWNSDGMPTTITKTVEVSSSNSFNITAGLRFINDNNLDQTYLAGTDININISVPSGGFRCTIVKEPQEITEPQETIAYYTYDANATSGPNGMITAKADAPNSSWQYYVIETSTQIVVSDDEFVIEYGDFLSESACKNDEYYTNDVVTPCVKKSDEKYTIRVMAMGTTSQSTCEETLPNLPSGCVCSNINGETYTKVISEVCAVFNNSSDGTVCLKTNDYANVDSYYEKMHNLGLTCNDYQNGRYLQCSNGSTYYQSGSLTCWIYNTGGVGCGFASSSYCFADDGSAAECKSH